MEYYLYLVRLAERHLGEPENYSIWFYQVQKAAKAAGLRQMYRYSK